MIKDVKLANQILFGVVVILAIAVITLTLVDQFSDSTSTLRELTTQILFILIFVAIFVRAIVNKDNLGKYVSLVVIPILLVFLVVFVTKRVL